MHRAFRSNRARGSFARWSVLGGLLVTHCLAAGFASVAETKRDAAARPAAAYLRLDVTPETGSRVYLTEEGRSRPPVAVKIGQRMEIKPDKTYRCLVSSEDHQSAVFEVRAKKGETVSRTIALMPWPKPAVSGERPANRMVPLDEAGRVTLDLVGIPAGSFVMGSEPSPSEMAQRARGDEWVRTAVTLTQPYWLGRTEVTQEQWVAIGMKNRSDQKGTDLPVEGVSWHDAMEFCRRLTERERAAGRLPVGYAYTLPTEAQWEFACRAGATGQRPEDLEAVAWYLENSRDRLHAVALKQPNAWGLHDMQGNVWEWCLDWYAGRLSGGEARDPQGPSSGKMRVKRGGDYSSPSGACRISNRSGMWSESRDLDMPGGRDIALGFRIALGQSAH